MEETKVVYIEEHEHPVKYWPYWVVWVVLLILTGLTVWVKELDFGKLSTAISLTIATTKVSLVAAVFMHLWHEKRVFKIILAVAIIILLIFISLTFLDVAFR